MDIGSLSSATAASVDSATDVKLIKGQSKRLEAVVGTILQGIEATPRADGQTGQKLNVVARR